MQHQGLNCRKRTPFSPPSFPLSLLPHSPFLYPFPLCLFPVRGSLFPDTENESVGALRAPTCIRMEPSRHTVSGAFSERLPNRTTTLTLLLTLTLIWWRSDTVVLLPSQLKNHAPVIVLLHKFSYIMHALSSVPALRYTGMMYQKRSGSMVLSWPKKCRYHIPIHFQPCATQ